MKILPIHFLPKKKKKKKCGLSDILQRFLKERVKNYIRFKSLDLRENHERKRDRENAFTFLRDDSRNTSQVNIVDRGNGRRGGE